MRSRLSMVALVTFLLAAIAVPAAQAAKKCDPIDARACLLPWPNDYFTKADKRTPTGKRLDLPTGSLPASTSGQPLDTSAFSGNDGFSPGAQIMTQVPGLDLSKTDAAPINNVGAYTGKNQAVVVIDTKTGKRWPIWSEINSHAAAVCALMTPGLQAKLATLSGTCTSAIGDEEGVQAHLDARSITLTDAEPPEPPPVPDELLLVVPPLAPVLSTPLYGGGGRR